MPKKNDTLMKVSTVVGAKGNDVKVKTVNGFVKTGRIAKAGGHLVTNIFKNTVNRAYEKPNVQQYVEIQAINKKAKNQKKADRKETRVNKKLNRKLKRKAWIAVMLQETPPVGGISSDNSEE